MTLSERYTIFRYRLWRARRKLPLVLIPAGWIALWIAVPFSVYDGIVYAAFCIACSLCASPSASTIWLFHSGIVLSKVV